MKSIYTAVICLIVFISGCDMFDANSLVEKPSHIMTADNLYVNYTGFETGLNGVYNGLRAEFGGGNNYRGALMNTGTDVAAVNLHTPAGPWSLLRDWESTNNSSNGMLGITFNWLYSTINDVNTIITRAEGENIDWSGGSLNPEGNKNLVLAEARAIRAWAYRHLTYLWGDVPLSLEESTGSTIRTDWVRAPVQQVREQIIFDLKFAEQHIPIEPDLDGRFSKGAVQTYLAEMYLAVNKPDSSLLWSNKAINTPEYQLITQRYGTKANEPGVPFMDMFHDGNEDRSEGNTEALWVWQYERDVTGGSGNMRGFTYAGLLRQLTRDGVQIITPTNERGNAWGTRRASLTRWALQLFEPGDDRGSDFAIRSYYILKDADQNTPYPADQLVLDYEYGDTIYFDDMSVDLSPEKEDDRTMLWPWSRKLDAGTIPGAVFSSSSTYNDIIYIRLAETYLLKAEAQYLLNDSPGAAMTINEVRRRSNASDITAGMIDMDFILDERARELALEEHRRYTLLRTGKWLERTRAHNNNGGQLITARDTLYPIPHSVIEANTTAEMPQNEGYPQ
ncbi:MAG: RagB/SusD family nutrient uptake outer membrane protein [Balneolales bacterium]